MPAYQLGHDFGQSSIPDRVEPVLQVFLFHSLFNERPDKVIVFGCSGFVSFGIVKNKVIVAFRGEFTLNVGDPGLIMRDRLKGARFSTSQRS